MGGSCWLRGGFESTGLPYMGQVTIDRSELAYLEASGLLFPVVLHEFGHALGFSSYVWTNHGLLGFSGITCQAASETWFSGASAVSQWQSLGGTGMVPVADYWSGSCSHWDDLAFGDETMTAFTGAMDLLSTVTIGSLADLGYSVDYAAADPYTLPDDARARSTAAPLTVRDEVQPPVGWVAPDGTRHFFDDSE